MENRHTAIILESIKMKKLSIIIILSALLASGLTAQDSSDTIEDIYLQNIKVNVIKQQASSDDRDSKYRALVNIESMIADGYDVANMPEVMTTLRQLAGEGVSNIVRVNGHIVNDFPLVRMDACRLMGELPTEASYNALVDILQNEEQITVLSEAIFALGKIGINENREVTTWLTRTINQKTVTDRDDNFAYASLLAIEKFIEVDPDLVHDPAITETIMRIAAQGTYIRIVREKANELMDKIFSS